jgi:hypothetical protein
MQLKSRTANTSSEIFVKTIIHPSYEFIEIIPFKICFCFRYQVNRNALYSDICRANLKT